MRAIISGAGIAGLTAAWWLGRGGWDVLVVERVHGLRKAGYMIDFFGSGYEVAERMGLLPRLRELGYRMNEIVAVDAEGRHVARAKYDLFLGLLNGRLLDLLRSDLERVLFEVRPVSVEIRYTTTIAKIRPEHDRVVVTLSDGREEQADVVIGADGIHSRVRELIFGQESHFLRYLGYHSAAFTFEDPVCNEFLHGNVHLMAAPGRHAGIYPIRAGKVAAFFVHQHPDPQLSEPPCAELRRVYRNIGGMMPTLLAHCDRLTDIYADVVAQIEMPAWAEGRIALVGDACSAVSLVAGQGASVAMGSAYALARALSGRESVEKALHCYEMQLRPIVRRKQAAGRRIAGWLFPTSRWQLTLRNLAFGFGRIPGMSWLMRPVLAAGRESLVQRADTMLA